MRLVLLCALVVVSLGLALAACAQGDGAVREPPTVEEAFEAAHPDGRIPPGLQSTGMSGQEVGDRLRDAVGEEALVLLPRWLPRGFGLAAPYVAIGDGGARPNPEAWGQSYRVSYTDGKTLVVVTVGADEVPPGLRWQAAEGEIDGHPLRVATSGSTAVVATLHAPLVVVVGERVPLDVVLRIARSLSPVDPR